MFSTSVLAFGSGTNIVGSERSRGTVLTNGWWKFRKTFLVCLSIGIMVFFRSVFFMKSRMNREVHVRFCERFGGVTPPYLLDLFLKSGYEFSLRSSLKVPVDGRELSCPGGIV